MPDWKQRARAMAQDIPEDAVERITPALDGLEAAFRPLVEQVRLESEPSYVQMVGREKEA
ncbi:MAG: hypothetical protein U0Q16_37355 [Bryobacteraceae bacterium]